MSKKSILEQMIAILSLIFAVVLISIIAIPQMLQALFRLIYCQRKEDIDGKLAIVTGGGSYFGRCIVQKLAERGCNLVIVDDNLEKIERLAKEVRSENVKVSVYCTNTCDNQEVSELFDKVNEEFDDIDLLINIPQFMLNCENDSSKLIAEKMSTSFNSTMIMTLKFLDKFKQQNNSSRIVSISSCAGLSNSLDFLSTDMTYNFMNSISDHLKERKLDKKIKMTCVLPCFVLNGQFITKYLNKFFKFNPVNVNLMADEIIRGITEQEKLIEIPNNFTNLTKFLMYIAKLIFFIIML
ncbi:hypothetical protein PVAND_013417 [Polypedilum vanderplanki]|uniref:Uncharacterized protein n=1 Tax=Polypedilum vanderplanki TaxID=319348 RepID=A0A9J6CQE9_POLVA|nr:hypothetical protein PVAND_013417 [Polypedilum vanderplanki]